MATSCSTRPTRCISTADSVSFHRASCANSSTSKSPAATASCRAHCLELAAVRRKSGENRQCVRAWLGDERRSASERLCGRCRDQGLRAGACRAGARARARLEAWRSPPGASSLHQIGRIWMRMLLGKEKAPGKLFTGKVYPMRVVRAGIPRGRRIGLRPFPTSLRNLPRRADEAAPDNSIES
jgi:hypothetical protein